MKDKEGMVRGGLLRWRYTKWMEKRKKYGELRRVMQRRRSEMHIMNVK